MGIQRCEWAGNDPLYVQYHDEEWGRPLHDDTRLFEMLCLEGAQAGLSWITILRKRENYRAAFDGFDPVKIATYDDERCAELLQNPGIVRNRLKVRAFVRNAQSFLKVQAEYGGFDRYIWQFVDGKPMVNHWRSLQEVPVSTAEAESMSKDLKRRGFTFVGPTICYAYMQAAGMVDDHIVACFCHTENRV